MERRPGTIFKHFVPRGAEEDGLNAKQRRKARRQHLQPKLENSSENSSEYYSDCYYVDDKKFSEGSSNLTSNDLEDTSQQSDFPQIHIAMSPR